MLSYLFYIHDYEAQHVWSTNIVHILGLPGSLWWCSRYGEGGILNATYSGLVALDTVIDGAIKLPRSNLIARSF